MSSKAREAMRSLKANSNSFMMGADIMAVDTEMETAFWDDDRQIACLKSRIAQLEAELAEERKDTARVDVHCDRAWISGAKCASNYINAGNATGLNEVIRQKQSAIDAAMMEPHAD